MGYTIEVPFVKLAGRMIVYSGSLEDTFQLIQFLRREAPRLQILRRVIVSRDKTLVLDVNGDGLEFPGVTFDSAALQNLLEELGVVFDRAALLEPPTSPDGLKEFGLGAVWTWGHG